MRESSEGGTSGEGGTNADPVFDLADVGPFAVIRGQSTHVPVSITRRNAFTQPVTIEVRSLPAGVMAAPVTLESATTTGEIVVTSEESAPQAKVAVSFVAASEPAPSVTKQASLLVRSGVGERDATFGQNGVATIPSFVTGDLVTAKDGSLYLVGNGPTHSYVAHVNVDGTLDKAFGTGGLVELTGAAPNGRVDRMALRSDGSIVAVVHDSLETSFHVHAIRPNGGYVGSFGMSGVATIATPGGFVGVVVDASDGILCGVVDNNTLPTKLVRLGLDGSADSAYAAKALSADGHAGWQRMLAQPDGTIVLLGFHGRDAGGDDVGLARVTASASPVVALPPVVQALSVLGAVVDPQGRILGAGRQIDAGGVRAAFLVRALGDGSADAGFMRVLEPFAAGDAPEFESVFVQPSGAILAVGSNHVAATNVDAVVLARYAADGSRDATFGNAGIIVDDGAPGTTSPGAALDNRDAVLVARTSATSTFILRYWR